MNSNGKSNTNWMYIFSIASVWFGTHVGGGFASGRQTMTFFVSYGWYAIFLPAIAMILVGLTYREQLIVAKNHRTFDYNSMSHKLYAPYDNFMSPVYEVCNVMAGFLAISASIAGGASLLQEIFGMPFMVAIVLLGIGVLLLAKFGSTLVRRVSTLLTLIIVFAFVVLCTKGISMQSSQLNEIVAAKQATTGFGSALWKAITYAGFQCFAFMGLLSSARDIQDTPTITKSMVIGYILNASMITLTAVLMVAWIPQLTEQPPSYTIHSPADGYGMAGKPLFGGLAGCIHINCSKVRHLVQYQGLPPLGRRQARQVFLQTRKHSQP